jgi:signal transduction histidine kinase/AraC-like DNA-binding protein
MKRYYLTYLLLIFSSLCAAGQAGRSYSPDNDFSGGLIATAPPWYLSLWAILLYVGLSLIFVWFLTTLIKGKLYRQAESKRRRDEHINEAKLQFFTNISHEIRTPMTLIVNPLEKLIAESKDASLRKKYVMIYRNAQRILRLVNQLMDIHKLDKGQMKLHFRETEIVGFIEETMFPFDYLSRKKNIAFNFVHPDERLYVWIDPDNFDKVLLNILSNAFKYTHDNGSITISLERDATHFTISVTDNGIGIDESDLEDIFERFYRVNNDLTNANFGTGIGMHLARSLVKMHHGTITAAGRDDATGTRFTVRLPLGSKHLSVGELESSSGFREALSGPSSEARVFGDAEAEERPRSKTRYRVLVVDDERDIREYIKGELAPLFRVSEAADGKSALEIVLNQGVDLVISDILMPGMDGMELVRRIKQNININHIPVILLTSKVSDESRIEGLDVGADGYITKPFNTEVLRSTAMNLLENRERLRNSFAGQQLIEDMTRRIELKSVDEQLMERVMDFINDNISNSDLSVEILASGVGMSRVHLHRRLKYLTGQSAGDFIKAIRLRQAASLLGEGKFTVSEVAYATGFSNLSHFSNSFKEFYGMSPTAYVNKPS